MSFALDPNVCGVPRTGVEGSERDAEREEQMHASAEGKAAGRAWDRVLGISTRLRSCLLALAAIDAATAREPLGFPSQAHARHRHSVMGGRDAELADTCGR